MRVNNSSRRKWRVDLESMVHRASTVIGISQVVCNFVSLNNMLNHLCIPFQPVFHDWCNKGRGMCYHVCGMMHIKEPMLLIGKSSRCGGSGFPLSLSDRSFTICLTPYNRK